MLNTQQIQRIVKQIPEVRRHFLGVFPRDRLPPSRVRLRLPACFIINSDTANLPGQHWTAVFIDSEKRGYYFDSYGYLPPPRLQRWLNTNTRKWSYNTAFLQSIYSSLCGYYCLYFLFQMCCGKDLQSIVNRLYYSRNSDRYIRSFFNC